MFEQGGDFAPFGDTNKNGGVMAKTMKGLLQLQQRLKRYDLDGVIGDAIGNVEQNGMWLVYGSEKQGKTWFSLKLADYFTRFAKTMYVSDEQGFDDAFIESAKRVNIDVNNTKLLFETEINIDELEEILSKQRAPRVIFIDNVTTYTDELKGGRFKKLVKDHPNQLFIFIAHEENGKPHLATAKAIQRLSKIIVHVQGLACHVSGRCKGGVLMIDENKARLFHGEGLKSSNPRGGGV